MITQDDPAKNYTLSVYFVSKYLAPKYAMVEFFVLWFCIPVFLFFLKFHKCRKKQVPKTALKLNGTVLGRTQSVELTLDCPNKVEPHCAECSLKKSSKGIFKSS